MLHTYEALLQPDGRLRFLDPPIGETTRARRVLVIFTDDPIAIDASPSGAVLSEPALAADWLRDEEDVAWTHLQEGK